MHSLSPVPAWTGLFCARSPCSVAVYLCAEMLGFSRKQITAGQVDHLSKYQAAMVELTTSEPILLLLS